MTPFDIAKKMYGDKIYVIMNYCFEHGVVYSDDDVFVCAYPTKKSLVEKDETKVVDNPDTWYIYICSGSLIMCRSLLKPLKYVAYRRSDGRVRVFNFKKMEGLLWETL